jgi:glycosyltransferase involved in cell wall biosynthesis
MSGTRAIWVLGMHRSGTSLTAGLLRLLGADLGPQDGLLPPDERDNPRGYWERREVIDLNNDLLARLSGSSWAPPALPESWDSDPALDDIRDRARRVLERFDPSRVWVIKDPRLSLTLPFWLPLVDESAAVLCLRSPRDVAASLYVRDPDGPLSRRDWTAVWHDYTAAALQNARALPREVVSYDDWFGEGRPRQLAALAGLLEGLGQAPMKPAHGEFDAFLESGLRHHASTLEQSAADPETLMEARSLYLSLCSARAGSNGHVPRPAAAPRTSVIMAAYNAVPAELTEAVDSVLGQTVGELELIVVDDGSDRPVADVLAEHHDERLRIVRHPVNRGLSAARNTALRLAQAPLVSHLDSDDAWEPRYLERVLPRFDDPRVGLVYTNAAILDHPTGHGTYIFDPEPHPIDSFPKIAEQNPIPLLTATARTAAVRKAGGYARWLRGAQDYYLWCRLAAAGWRFAFVDEKLARYRWPIDSDSMSYHRRRVELDELLMWFSFFLRHPDTPGPRRQLRVRVRREFDRLRVQGPRRR